MTLKIAYNILIDMKGVAMIYLRYNYFKTGFYYLYSVIVSWFLLYYYNKKKNRFISPNIKY